MKYSLKFLNDLHHDTLLDFELWCELNPRYMFDETAVLSQLQDFKLYHEFLSDPDAESILSKFYKDTKNILNPPRSVSEILADLTNSEAYFLAAMKWCKDELNLNMGLDIKPHSKE